jgi:hypothetical protein
VKRSDQAEAAATLRRLLGAVEAGELEPGTAGMVRWVEGAAIALELAAGVEPDRVNPPRW